MKVSFKFDRRYFVLGAYKSHYYPALHIYPLPFMRMTISWKEGVTAK